MTPMPRDTFHNWGKYLIRIERQGRMFVYDVCNRGTGLAIVCGLDALSLNRGTVLSGIVERLQKGSGHIKQ